MPDKARDNNNKKEGEKRTTTKAKGKELVYEKCQTKQEITTRRGREKKQPKNKNQQGKKGRNLCIKGARQSKR